MSSLAATEIGGEARTAWEYHSEYLLYGTEYSVFYCPFCDVRLAAGAVYVEEGASKISPYFSARWEQHQNGCDGEAIIENSSHDSRPPKNHRIARIGIAPEMLVDRPPPRAPRPIKLPELVNPPSEQETNERRKRAGSLGVSIPRTYLLQPLVEAKNIILSEVYKSAKENKWSQEKIKIEIENALSKINLQLADKTNYAEAFKPLSYVHYTLPRIYHATCKVDFTDGKFILINHFIRKKTNTACTFEVVINANSITEASPRSHKAILRLLDDLYKSRLRPYNAVN